jgi:probable HAF family extracellular repeat protein
MTDLGTLPGGTWSFARAINSSGQIVGYSATNGSIGFHAFFYSNGTMTDLGASSQNIFNYSINDAGQVVFTGANGHVFLYSNGTLTDLGVGGVAASINSSGQIVGASGGHAFLYSNGVISDLNTLVSGPHPTFSFATGINDSGQIIVQGAGVDGHAYLLTPKTPTAVPEPSSMVLLGIGAATLMGYVWRRRTRGMHFLS